jgi:hypothetical protein
MAAHLLAISLELLLGVTMLLLRIFHLKLPGFI